MASREITLTRTETGDVREPPKEKGKGKATEGYPGSEAYIDKTPARLRKAQCGEMGVSVPIDKQEFMRAFTAITNFGGKMDIREMKDLVNVVKYWTKNNLSKLNDPEGELDKYYQKVSRSFSWYTGYRRFNKLPASHAENDFRNAVREYKRCFEEKCLLEQIVLADIREVGENKALGYLPLNAITLYNETPEKLQKQVRDDKIHTFFVGENETTASDTLWACDYDEAQKIIQAKEAVVKDAGWPTDPHMFVERVTRETALKKTPLFDVIADLFADHTNPNRLDMGDGGINTLQLHQKYGASPLMKDD